MQVTEVTISLQSARPKTGGGLDGRLLAFATIVLDDALCVHGIKVVRGIDGHPFVDMPTRAIEVPCHRCRVGNRLQDYFCRRCGIDLGRVEALAEATGPQGKLQAYKSVVHPIHQGARDLIQDAVLERYFDEKNAVEGPRVAAPLAGHMAATGRD